MRTRQSCFIILALILGGTSFAGYDMTVISAGFLPRGTELVELRAANARHFSNGDGSIRAIILASDLADAESTIVPVEAGYSGHVYTVWGLYFKSEQRTIRCGTDARTPGQEYEYRAFAEWNVSSIPDGSTILGLRCSSYCYPSGESQPPPVPDRVILRDMSVRPQSGDAQSLFADIGSGAIYGVYENPDPYPAKWLDVELSFQACLDLESKLAYDWFAVGYDDEGTGNWWGILFEGSNAEHKPRLIVDYVPGAPSRPTPQQPENGSVVEVFRPTLQVSPVTGAESYQFRLFQTGGSEPIFNVVISSNAWTVPEDLVHGESYEWDCRVRKNGTWSGFFYPRWTFTVRIPRPAAPVPVAPVPNASVGTLKPTFVVEDVPGADCYGFWVYKGGTLIECTTNAGTSWTMTQNLENGVTYQWNAAAKNIAGWGDPFLPVRYFTVRLPPEPLSPANGEPVDTMRPVLEVKAYPGATKFHFRVYRVSTGDLVAQDSSDTRTWRVNTFLANGQWYEWECRAKIANGWSPMFEPRWTFRVADLPNPPVPQYPQGGEIVTCYRPTLKVNSSSGVLKRHFRIFRDGNLETEGFSTSESWFPATDLSVDNYDYEWDCRDSNVVGWGPFFSPRAAFRLEGQVPPQPVAQSPANGDSVSNYRPQLRVAAINDAQLYRFRVFQKGSSEPLKQVETSTYSWSLDEDLTNAQWYFWDCQAKNAKGWGAYFVPRCSFKIRVLPSVPVLKSPAQNEELATLTPTLEVFPVSDADQYNFRVFEGTTKRADLYTSGSETYVVVPELVNGRTYTWDCRAHNVAGWSAFSSRRTFKIKILPVAPEPVAPENGIEVNTACPELEVLPVADAEAYEFQVWQGGTVVARTTDAGTKWTIEPGLVGGLEYTWECRARNAAGWGSFFSPRWSFRIAAVPGPPVPLGPEPGEQVPDLTPTLVVSPVTAAIAYNFQVYDGETDALVVETVTDRPSWAVYPALQNGKEYWWQCRAQNQYGWGAFFSPRRNFRTRVLPETPVPVEPQDGAMLFTVQPKLSVQQIEGALEYHFQVYEEPANDQEGGEGKRKTGKGLVAEGYSETNSWVVSQELESGKTYWWQCRARNEADWGEFFGPRFCFTVFGGPNWPEKWSEALPMLSEPSGKAAKDGAWLAAGVLASGEPVVWVAKGNKSTDFYEYKLTNGSWYKRAGMGTMERGKEKLPYKGSVGVSDGAGHVYATKGNNTLGFWRYHAEGDSWHRLPDVPEGRAGKKVKGGTDLVFVRKGDTGWVYLLKGIGNEFYRYNTVAGRWDTMKPAPVGEANPKYEKGSFLVYDGNKSIYCHQAKYRTPTNHFMFRFDLEQMDWDSRFIPGMPLMNTEGRVKRSGDGAAGVWYNGFLYALKGGGTCEFYRFDPRSEVWQELDTMPSYGASLSKKKVKAGGDLISLGSGYFLALKGGKTRELWRYWEPAGQLANQSRQYDSRTSEVRSSGLRFSLFPNPLKPGVVYFHLTDKAERMAGQIRIFDVTGRCVYMQELSKDNWYSGISLDLRRLASGTYLVRLEAEGEFWNQRIVLKK